MQFMPTGGINEKNLNTYLDFPKIIACGGSWMVNDAMIKAGEFDKIKALTKEAVTKMLGFELRHVGINASEESEADGIAASFEKLFGFTKNAGINSIFAGLGIEVMKTPYLGRNGHIAIQTNYIERAVYHLELQGAVFNMDTVKYDDKGNFTAIYMKEEIGGFAVHLLQK
jgi:2-dehydro-3-deoxyphosphogluconate aldolase / (4S)-4-hydroxy-2-oxoglutarate aldolase